MKIYGNTVGMGLPKPNLMQKDPTKGDYVKGKEAFLQQVGDLGGAVTDKGKRPNRMMISFMDDDCRAAVAGPDDVNSLEYLIGQKKIPYTLACPPGNIGDDGFLTVADLQRMVAKGVTVACHHWRQYNMDDAELLPNVDAYEADLQRCQDQFATWGIPVETVAYPQGKILDEYMPIVKDFYRMGFTVNKGVNQIPYASYYMDRVGLFKNDENDDGTASLAEAKDWVDQLAEMESGWLVFMTHAWYKGFKPALLGELIDYIQSEEIRSKGIEIVDIHEALNTTGNIVEAGNVEKPFEDATAPFFVMDAAGTVHTNSLKKYTNSSVKLTELKPDWHNNYFLTGEMGALKQPEVEDNNRRVSADIEVNAGEIYRVSCSCKWDNAAYAVLPAKGAVPVDIVAGTTNDEYTTVNRDITIPEGGTILRLSCNLNVQPEGYKIYKVEYVGETEGSEAPAGSVEVDPTLTKSGAAADAKVVGDKLKELSGSGSSQNVELDTTLTKSGAAADAAATGARIKAAEDAITAMGGTVRVMEPAADDIPKVYFTGTLPVSKDEEDVRLSMRYISKTADFTCPVTLKVQGSSSTSYAKKNFTLKPYKDSTYESKKKLTFKNWPEMNKFVLKAHWIDHSHVRNVGTAKIWGKVVASRSDYDSLPEELRNSPNNGATDGFTCKVFCNGVYQGLYEWIVAKDKLFGQDSDIATHSILNSELNNQPACAFATTSPTMNGNWSEELQDSMSADISASFANLIKFVAGATDEEFVANAETYFDVQSVIDFNIFARVFCIVDNLCRNQIFFTYDGVKWYEGVWDVDAILGLPPTVRGFFSYDTEFQTGYIAYKDFGVTNLLYQRVETLFAERFKARYAELRSGVLSVDNIIDVYEQLTDTIKTYDGLLEEDYASTTGGGKFTGIPYKTENSIQQIRNFVAQRLPYMDEAVAKIGIGEDTGGGDSEKIPCTGITLSASEMTFTGEGTQTLTATVEPENTTDPVVWAIDNASVATVRDGVVTAISNGGATITARCGEHSATCTVTVSGIDTVNIFSGVEFKTAFINGSGVEGTSENDVCCDFVDVEDYIGVPLVFDIAPDNNSSNNSNRVLFYDESQTFKSMVTQNLNSESTINCIGNEVFAFTVPSGCKYMRVSANNNVAQNIPLEALYIRRLDTNRYNAEDAQDGHYNLEDGVVTTNSGYSHTSMSVQAGERYFIKNVYSAVFFGTDGGWLGKANLKNGSFGVTVPDGCATIGWNFSNNNVNTVEIYEMADTTQIGYYAVKQA